MFWKRTKSEGDRGSSTQGFTLGAAGSAALNTSVPGTPLLDPVPQNRDLLQAQPIAQEQRIPCVVPRGRRHTGSFSYFKPVRIEGIVRGKIFSTSTVVISADAVVEAEVHARSVVIAGKFVQGKCTADFVELLPNGILAAPVEAAAMRVSEGSTLNAALVVQR